MPILSAGISLGIASFLTIALLAVLWHYWALICKLFLDLFYKEVAKFRKILAKKTR